MTKKVLKIAGIVAGIIGLIVIGYLLYVKAQIESGKLVKWNNQWYTKEELAKKYPPQYQEVPAQNTPEEVYVSFRQALLDNDLEKALSFITEEKRDGYRSVFGEKEKLDKWVKTLPGEISNGRISGNFGYYDWDKNDEYKHTIDFVKNESGYWQIDSI